MPKDTAGFVRGRRLLRSGPSIGSNVEEAIDAFSKDDFTFKMNIALKEARETNYWFRLLRDSGIMKEIYIKEALDESEHLKKYFISYCKNFESKEIRI